MKVNNDKISFRKNLPNVRTSFLSAILTALVAHTFRPIFAHLQPTKVLYIPKLRKKKTQPVASKLHFVHSTLHNFASFSIHAQASYIG